MIKIADIALLAAALAAPSFALAGETRLDHKAILATLTGATIEGSDWSQTFEKGGATEYVSQGKTSNGRWDVQGDQYCSMWPPSDQWTCYAVASAVANGVTTISWIGADGSRESGRLIAKGR
jgi:hypothetical protein